jgi:hypothetical protein
MKETPAETGHATSHDGRRTLARVDIGAIGFSDLEESDPRIEGANLGTSSLAAAVLAFGCRIWFVGGWEFVLPAPAAITGSPAYAAELLKAMSDRLPKRDDAPAIKNVSEILEGLSDVCRRIDSKAASDTIGRAAFLAGISIGRLGHISIDDEQYKLAAATLEKSQTAKLSRAKVIEQKRLDYERRLLTFALNETAADPEISNAAIQRRWRKSQKLSETVTSNNEAKTLTRFRRDGRLPLRGIGKNI